MIAYGTKTLQLPSALMLNGLLIGTVVAAVVVGTGWLVDWYSAIKVGVLSGLLMIVLAFPLFELVGTGKPAMIYLSMALGTGVVGSFSATALPAIMGPMFNNSVRYSGMAISFALAASSEASCRPSPPLFSSSPISNIGALPLSSSSLES